MNTEEVGHLLTTKLHNPEPRSNQIPRPRLTERLNKGLDYPLTLVAAPVGFGKTTALGAWIRQSERPVAWLGLDEEDNDPTRFWTYLIAALQTRAPHVGEHALAMVHAQGQPLPRAEFFLTSLLNDVAALAKGLVLVLDDYHVISAPDIHEGVAFLVEHLPPPMHLVISTRSDPPLPLARWRARDQLTEIRADDLRFTPDEAAAFLNRAMGLNLLGEDIRTLEARTEGWVAGLQLAALSMQGQDDAFKRHFVSSLTGSQRYVLDYLTDEVLRREPANIQTFLLQTSILDRLSAPLCDAVTERTGSQETLERLERANLFIIPLDAERHWYRYHPLFADVLRHKLQQANPDQVPELHKRAGAWCEAQGLIDDAVRYALAAGDAVWAARLVEQYVNDVLRRGEGETFRRWLAAIPPEVTRARPRLALAQALAAFNAGRLEMIEPLLGEAERALATAPADLDTPPAGGEGSALANVPAAIALLRASLAGFRGDAEQMSELTRLALTYLSEDERGPYYSVRWNLAMADWMRGRLAEAERVFADIVTEGETAAELHLALSAGASLGRVQRTQGRLSAALHTYERGLEFADRAGLSSAPSTAMAHLGMADVLRERNQLEQALRHATDGIALGRRLTSTQWLANGLATLAWIRQAMGDWAAALNAMDEAHQVMPNLDVVALQNPVPAERARLWLAQGNVVQAARWVSERGRDERDELYFPREREYLILARVLLARNQPDRARGLLERLAALAEAEGRNESVIETRLLQALALDALDNRAQSLNVLTQALALAELEEYIRLFVDEGAPMLELLQQVRGEQRPYAAHLLTAFGSSELVGQVSASSPARAPVYAGRPALVEPLTERELEVLRLIVEGLSNQEIAQRLHVSVGTAKVHLKHIYGKLDVSSRTQAAARARELGLL